MGLSEPSVYASAAFAVTPSATEAPRLVYVARTKYICIKLHSFVVFCSPSVYDSFHRDCLTGHRAGHFGFDFDSQYISQVHSGEGSMLFSFFLLFPFFFLVASM
jgi:hypothetical protein